jgi:hypothetical protein
LNFNAGWSRLSSTIDFKSDILMNSPLSTNPIPISIAAPSSRIKAQVRTMPFWADAHAILGVQINAFLCAFYAQTFIDTLSNYAVSGGMRLYY